MSFVDFKTAEIIRLLEDVHYQFPRAERLHAALQEMMTKYYAEQDFLRILKQRQPSLWVRLVSERRSEIDHQRSMFNEALIEMPDGRPAKMVKVMLRGSSSWKELGVLTLRALGYPIEVRGTVNQTQIWNQVVTHPWMISAAR
ncbi:MAG: hypothetical protein ACSHXB_05545 [Sulfitobacter sp.]